MKCFLTKGLQTIHKKFNILDGKVRVGDRVVNKNPKKGDVIFVIRKYQMNCKLQI